MVWHKVNFNVQNIERETGSAVLIKMPNKSSYGGYKFWHPSKLVRIEGGKGYNQSFSFSDTFTFKLFKNGNGSYNKYEIIDEININYEEMLEAFESTNKGVSNAINLEKEKKINKIIENKNRLNNPDTTIIEDLKDE